MLKEYRNILLGQKIRVYTDHKNLTYKNFNTKCMMHWQLVLKVYGSKLIYIKGENNIIADVLSRLDIEDTQQATKETWIIWWNCTDWMKKTF